MKRHTPVQLILITASLLIAACSPLRPSDPVRFYDLDTQLAADTGNTAPTVLVGPFELPDYLNRPQLVVRQGTRLELREFDRWAEPLDEALLRRLAAGLGHALSSAGVYQFPAAGLSDYRYRVTGRVLRLEADSSARVDLQAHWQLLDAAGETIAGPFNSQHSTQLDNLADMGPVTAELGRLLDRLSEDMASVIRQAD